MENHQPNPVQLPPLVHSSGFRVAAAFVALVVASMFFLNSDSSVTSGSQSAAVTVTPKERPRSEAFLELFRASQSRALEQNRVAFQMFEKELDQLRVKHDNRMMQASRRISSQVATYNNCTSLIGYCALDQVRSEQYAERYLKSLITPSLDGEIRLMQADLSRAVDTLAWELRRSTVTFATDLFNSIHNDGVQTPAINLEKLNEPDFKEALRGLGTSAVWTGFALGFDVYAVWQTNLLPRLWSFVKSLVAKVFARQVAVAVASISAAVIDGPLPIGDILAVGGVIWTGYDIWASRQEFEDQLEVALQENLRQSREEILVKALQAARTAYRGFDAQLGSVGKEILSQVEEE